MLTVLCIVSDGINYAGTVPAYHGIGCILNDLWDTFLAPWLDSDNGFFHSLGFLYFVFNPTAVSSVHASKNQNGLSRSKLSCDGFAQALTCFVWQRIVIWNATIFPVEVWGVVKPFYYLSNSGYCTSMRD